MGVPAAVRMLCRVAVALVRRPALWPTALRQLRRVIAPGWWRRPPFVPVPDSGWLRYRMELAYGTEPPARVDVHDIVEWLEWCREHERAAA
jgi:hypothetical protein